MSNDQNSGPTPRPGVLTISPYVQGASAIDGEQPAREPIKLSSNESSFGPSPAALQAFGDAQAVLHRYPDGSQTALRQAIARVHGLKAENIVCGNGSDELIQLVMRTFAGEGDEVLLSKNGFLMCQIHARAQGAKVVVAPEADDRVDVDALLSRVTERTKVLTIANPNNPTGTYLSRDEIGYLHDHLPQHVLLLLDSAYAEYATAADYSSGDELVLGSRNVVMTRTFSKIYGLSALRIGWAYLPDHLLDPVQRIRTPFNANGPAMAAAVAAVQDQAYVEKIRAHTARWIETITGRLSRLGLNVIPSVTNFYLVRFPQGCGTTADEAELALHRAGIIPRPMASRDEAELRITVGLDEENEAVLKVFDQVLKKRAIHTDKAHG